MISMDKKYKTRTGREVRIYAVDGEYPHVIHGAIKFDTGWKNSTWMQNGTYMTVENSLNDLIEVKPRIQREFWVNVYPPEHDISMYPSKEIADGVAAPSRIACVKVVIDCENGEGL